MKPSYQKCMRETRTVSDKSHLTGVFLPYSYPKPSSMITPRKAASATQRPWRNRETTKTLPRFFCSIHHTIENGTWTCSVDYVEVCRTSGFGRGAYTWTGTITGSSPRSMYDACGVAEARSKRVVCPDSTLKREISSCECEQVDPENRWSCLVDQTLWCHGSTR